MPRHVSSPIQNRRRAYMPLAAFQLTSKQWISLVSLLGVQLCAAFYLQGMAILAPAFALHYHLNALEVSALISIKAVGTVLGSLGIGISLDRIGGLHLSWIGLLPAMVLFAVTAGLVTSYPELLLSMLVMGMFLPVFSVAGRHAVTRDFPTELNGMLLGVLQSVIPLGGILAGALFPL